MKKEAIAWLDGITEFSLLAFIFTLPFSKSMVEIFFMLALTCWVVKRWIEYSHQSASFRGKVKEKILGLIKTFKPARTDLNLPIGVFILVGFLSTLTSVSLPLSLEGFFLKLFEWIMLYFIVAETINSKKRLNRVLIVMFFSMALIAIDAIFQFITGTDFIRHYATTGYRIQASFGNPNSFAGWLVIMISLALSLAYFRTLVWFNKIIKPILWAITALLIFCLALTYTRGAWIAVILSLIFLAIFRSKRLLIFIVVILLIVPFIAPERIERRASTIFQLAEKKVMRSYLWREALSIVEDFPLLGCGLNTYATVGPYYRITEETGVYPHNSYLHMAAESGLLGLGAFIWIMITLFRTSLANLKRIDNRFHSAILIGLLTGLFGFLVHSFVDVNFYTLQLGNLMWFVMGLIVAVQKVSLE